MEAAASIEEVALSRAAAGCGSMLPGSAKKVFGLLNTTRAIVAGSKEVGRVQGAN